MLRIPPWQGETPPNQLGQTGWMYTYLVLIWAVALVAAWLATRFIEQPAARRLRVLAGLEPAAPKAAGVPA
ncbi:hypothetical protein [Allofournierella massiliensis]|uniref:hypothetical protein n=1 Tax=Allofournierella massiliensis TaxID=1650663 RepID=UPI003562970A